MVLQTGEDSCPSDALITLDYTIKRQSLNYVQEKCRMVLLSDESTSHLAVSHINSIFEEVVFI